jgi:predicted DNA-binding transcriptional regulator AlpA
MSIGEKLDRIIQILENEKQEEERIMTIDELIEFLQYRYKKSTLYSMASTGAIPCTHKPLRFHKTQINNWLKNKQNESTTIRNFN